MITIDEKINDINNSLENVRDMMLGLDTSLKEYTLNDNNTFNKVKISKLINTLLFYIMQENPLYNKNDLKFYKYCLTSMVYFASNIEALPIENINFKMLISIADIIDCDPEVFADLVANSYFTMKPNFMLATFDGVENLDNITEEELSNANLTAATKEQEIELRKQWEKEHPNALLADEILEYNQTFFNNYDSIPDDFYAVIENVIYKFLNDEKKGYYNKDYLVKIQNDLLDAMTK